MEDNMNNEVVEETKNELALPVGEFKSDKELYQQYGMIVNTKVTPQAIEVFKENIKASKKISEKEANALLGELYYSQGNYLEAFNAYTASKINTDDVNGDFFGGLWGKIKAVMKKGQVVSDKMFLDEEQCKFNYLDTILRLKGNDLNVINLYERSIKKSPKMLKFEEDYKLMFETNRDAFDMCVKAKISVAMAYCNANDKKGYQKGFKILNELFTTIEDTRTYINNEVANKMIFYLMDQKESFDKIINTYYRYIELDNPDNESLNVHLGKYFFEQGRYELAKEHLSRTADSLSQIYLAKIYYRENKNENMYKVYQLINDKFSIFTKEEDYYMYADACLYIYKNENMLEPIDVIRAILALKEFIEGNEEGRKAPKVDAYYEGELSDLYFGMNDLENAQLYSKIYYDQIKGGRKPANEYETSDALNNYHLQRGRGLIIEKRVFEGYEHLSQLGNYSLVKDEILDAIEIIVNYATTDYDTKLPGRFNELIDIVRKVFPKKRKKRYTFYGQIYMKKCMLKIDFKQSYKKGKKYLKKNLSNRSKLKNLIEFYKENKKEMKKQEKLEKKQNKKTLKSA